MYRVMLWDKRGEVAKLSDGSPMEHANLTTCQKWCRGMGHTGEDSPLCTGYPPIAYVADEDGYLVYNPRFSKDISPAVGGLVNSRDSGHF